MYSSTVDKVVNFKTNAVPRWTTKLNNQKPKALKSLMFFSAFV